MCAGHQHPPREEGNPISFVRNFARAEGPLSARLARAWANFRSRGARRASCCGNYGEPGC